MQLITIVDICRPFHTVWKHALFRKEFKWKWTKTEKNDSENAKELLISVNLLIHCCNVTYYGKRIKKAYYIYITSFDKSREKLFPN